MLPDWVFRTGWGTSGVYDYLQLRMEAAQLGTSRAEARKARKAMPAPWRASKPGVKASSLPA